LIRRKDMGQNEAATDPESFTKEIEGTIEDLFRPEKSIEIDPLTNEVRDVADSREVAKVPPDAGPDTDLALELELDLDAGQGLPEVETAARSNEELLEECNQALLTLEWEVTKDNTHVARSCFSELVRGLKLSSDSSLGEIVQLMNRVFDAMEESPEEMPTSGPKALQEGLKTIMALTNGSRPAGDRASDLIATTKGVLKGAVQPISGADALEVVQEIGVERFEENFEALDLEIEPEPVAPVTYEVLETEEQPVPPPLATGSIGQGLAGGSPPADALRGDYDSRGGPAARGEGLDRQEEDLVALVKSHVVVLDRCIGRLLPVETLLARTPGTDKLHLFHKRLREELQRERDRLSGGLRGGHSPSRTEPVRHNPQRDEADHAEETSGPERESGLSPCPWNELITAQWQGRSVAFVPEQVAFEGSLPWWSRSKLREGDALALTAFKVWPWTKMKSLCKGCLAELEEAALSELQFPLLKPPEAVSSPSGTAKTLVLIILYDGEKGGIILLDTPTKVLPVSETCRWNPSAGGDHPGWAGFIEDSEESIPVATLQNLL
jgi:hypothetical protein